MRHYKPAYAAEMPKKINVKLPDGKIVLRSIRWGDFLPEWLDCADAVALVPYVVVDNQPLIICSEEKSGSRSFYLVTLSVYLESYGVQLLSTRGQKRKEWLRYIA